MPDPFKQSVVVDELQGEDGHGVVAVEVGTVFLVVLVNGILFSGVTGLQVTVVFFGVVEVVVIVQGGNEQGVVVFGEAVELQGEDAQGVVDGDTLIGVGVTVLFVCTVVFDVLLQVTILGVVFLTVVALVVILAFTMGFNVVGHGKDEQGVVAFGAAVVFLEQILMGLTVVVDVLLQVTILVVVFGVGVALVVPLPFAIGFNVVGHGKDVQGVVSIGAVVVFLKQFLMGLVVLCPL